MLRGLPTFLYILVCHSATLWSRSSNYTSSERGLKYLSYDLKFPHTRFFIWPYESQSYSYPDKPRKVIFFIGLCARIRCQLSTLRLRQGGEGRGPLGISWTQGRPQLWTRLSSGQWSYKSTPLWILILLCHTADHFQLGEVCGSDLHGMPRGQRPTQVRRQGLKALARDGIGSQNGVNPIIKVIKLLINHTKEDKEKNHLCGNLTYNAMG